jgi:hypothetical protein
MWLQRRAESPLLVSRLLPILGTWPRLLTAAAAMTRLPA